MHTISTTLRPGSHRDYVEQAQGAHQRARMENAERRRLIVEGDWRHLVWSLLWKYNYQDAARDAVAARVKRSPNLVLKTLRKVAVAYRVPPTRLLKGASEEATKAFNRLFLEEGDLLTAPARWEKLVWSLNTVITVPTVRRAPGTAFGQRLSYELLLPSNTEVVTPDDSSTSRPIASVTMIPTGEHDHQADWVVLDDKVWARYDATGNLLRRVRHGAGVWPGTEWRRIRGEDWWSSEYGAGLFDATLEAAHVAARRDWHRHGQDHIREILICDEMASIGEQVVGSDAPIEVPLDPNNVEYLVKDATMSIAKHQEHIVALGREGAETMEIDPDLLDFQPGVENVDRLAAARQHDDLVGIRRSSITGFSRSERDSAWKTALVLQGSGHPLSSLLRPSMVQESYEASWSELDFVDDPEKRILVLEDEINIGLKSKIDAYMSQHQGMTRSEAREEVLRIVDEEAEIAEILAKRNTPRLVRDRQGNIAELQGRIGGMESGQTRGNDDDNDDGRAGRRTDDPGSGGRRSGTPGPDRTSRSARSRRR